jgi:phage shock protein A
MPGFMKLFKNIGKSIDAKADAKADKIEAENAVAFSKQDVEKMQTELGKVNENIGTVKAEMLGLKDKVDGIKSEIKKHDDDAVALSESGKETLAEKHCEAAEMLEGQLAPLQEALKVQKNLLDGQISTKEQLKSAVQQAECDLVTLKAMDDAAKANEKLTTINTGSGTSALADFNKRKEDAKKRLIKSQVMKEESGPDTSLEDETKKALGTGGGSSRLAKLKNKG